MSLDRWRADRKNAAEVLAQLLPRNEQRHVFFDAVAAAIGAAHAVSDESWSVSLFPNRIRLNVGQVEIVTLTKDDAYLLLDPPSIPETLPSGLKTLIVRSKRYVSVPGEKILLHLSGDQFARWYPLLRQAHEVMATRAATAKKSTPHFHAFSEGVLLEAEHVLDRELPRPHVVASGRQLVVLIAMREDIKLLRDAAKIKGSVEWIVPKTSRLGDDVAVFLPGTGFVATGELASSPALGAGFGKSERRWRADVDGVTMLVVPVTIESIKEALPEWKWPQYPKSLTTVPTAFESTFRGVLARARLPGDEELPEQAGADEVFTEGATNAIRVNAFETSAVAKRRCVDHYGCKCFICGLRFAEAYGPAGEGLIHVHHLVPLSSIRREYQVNPVKDLRPVCPNCHALIHRRTPPYSPEEVTSMLKRGGRH